MLVAGEQVVPSGRSKIDASTWYSKRPLNSFPPPPDMMISPHIGTEATMTVPVVGCDSRCQTTDRVSYAAVTVFGVSRAHTLLAALKTASLLRGFNGKMMAVQPWLIGMNPERREGPMKPQ